MQVIEFGNPDHGISRYLRYSSHSAPVISCTSLHSDGRTAISATPFHFVNPPTHKLAPHALLVVTVTGVMVGDGPKPGCHAVGKPPGNMAENPGSLGLVVTTWPAEA